MSTICPILSSFVDTTQHILINGTINRHMQRYSVELRLFQRTLSPRGWDFIRQKIAFCRPNYFLRQNNVFVPLKSPFVRQMDTVTNTGAGAARTMTYISESKAPDIPLNGHPKKFVDTKWWVINGKTRMHQTQIDTKKLKCIKNIPD